MPFQKGLELQPGRRRTQKYHFDIHVISIRMQEIFQKVGHRLQSYVSANYDKLAAFNRIVTAAVLFARGQNFNDLGDETGEKRQPD